MIKTLNIEKEYKDIFALSQFAFQYRLSEEELQEKREEAKRHMIWGHMDGDSIAAKLHLIPLECYIGDKPIKMGGISSVATWPEYRRGGRVKELLFHALKYMKDQGQTISFLHPFSVPFYRKYGWELTFSNKSYTIPIEKFKKNWETKGYVRRTTGDKKRLNAIYHTFAKNYNGPLIRDENWWNQRVIKKHTHIAIAYDENENAIGYIQFKVEKDIFTVIDMAYVSTAGWKLLLEFIANHDSMTKKVKMTVAENDQLPLFIDEPRFEQTIEPYFMARIVDVFAFLNDYPWRKQDKMFTLHVTDYFLPENNGTYQVKEKVTKLPIQSTKGGVHCSIQQLTSMLLGYSQPFELYELGLIHGSREEVELLEHALQIRQPYFPDFF